MIAWHDALTFVACALLVGIAMGWSWGYDYAWHRRSKSRHNRRLAPIKSKGIREIRGRRMAMWLAKKEYDFEVPSLRGDTDPQTDGSRPAA